MSVPCTRFFCEIDAGGERRIGDQHHQRSGRIGIHHLADDAVRRDHGHAAFDAAGRPAIDEDHLRVGAGAVADDARGDGLGWRVGLKHAQRPGAIGRGELGLQVLVLHLELAVLALQLLVLAAHVQQNEVVLDEAPGVAAHQFQARLDGSDGGDRPDADQRNVLVGLDLVGDQQQLRRDHDQQDREIAVAAEKEIHTVTITLSSRLADSRLVERDLLDRNSSEQFEIRQHLAGSQHHARQRILGDRNRQSGLFANPLI